MAVVHLVRHGQASFGAAEYDELSAVGREQARTVGAALAAQKVRIDHAVSGTMRRQRDTADLCLKAADHSAGVSIDGRFDEYDHLGLAAAMQDGPLPTSSADFQAVLDAALLRWISGGAGTPPWAVFRERACAGLDDFLGSLGKGGSGVAFTSGGVITAICSRLLELTPAGCVALHRVVINGGITKIVSGRGGMSLISFNEHSHLPAAMVTYR